MTINFFVVSCFIFQYCLALSNLSDKNSPIKFPYPYQDEAELMKIKIPWYRTVDFFTRDSNAWSYY